MKTKEEILQEKIKRKIAKAKRQINAESYLANDVWDSTHGERIYQDINVPVIEVKKIKEILDGIFNHN